MSHTLTGHPSSPSTARGGPSGSWVQVRGLCRVRSSDRPLDPEPVALVDRRGGFVSSQLLRRAGALARRERCRIVWSPGDQAKDGRVRLRRRQLRFRPSDVGRLGRQPSRRARIRLPQRLPALLCRRPLHTVSGGLDRDWLTALPEWSARLPDRDLCLHRSLAVPAESLRHLPPPAELPLREGGP
jgi:hypothetical protein